ncbi:hypothetical protein AM587_10002842 [Phytophthora nicotianae]|uniref:Uncharacterized protein n=1 Tax=Phytophthora nicotianae TaxID=4792 RepID=A0A0W8BYF6_PHYNI|nr:hypothetical protein AM587_10002842 [Phytophthora nicotianae]
MHMRRSDDTRSPTVENKVTQEITSKLEMAIGDAITALEFDYYVLGVALFRFFTTVGFCVIFAVLVNSGTPNEEMYTQSNAVSAKLAPATSSPFHIDTTVQFFDIDSVDDVYDWLTDTFIPTVFVKTDHTGKALPTHQLGHLDLANRVLGGVILEMTPREYKSCDKEFVLLELYPMCTYIDYPGKQHIFCMSPGMLQKRRLNNHFEEQRIMDKLLLLTTYCHNCNVHWKHCKLSHSDVIVNGKFRPPVLLMVLKKKLKDDGAYTSTTMLTPTLLRGFFPYCAVSDKEMIDTFEFLRQGLLLNEAVTKQSPTKKFESEKAKTSRVAELQQNLAMLLEQINNDCQWDAITCLL